MAIIKCKMCGGDLEIIAGNSVATCEYCGTQQTVPSADSEKKMTLFGRAGRLLRGCEFDKAAGVYESIVADFPDEAEAYWGLVLCKYGIEYVDDPATGKKIPTCHRSSFECVMDDSNLEQVMENADVVARRVYRDEAKAIEELRKGIIEISGKEDPYDIFICYKETDANGERTIDSVIAQDVYDALMEKGYRVFFSRITLEDKLGQEYEPYIFAALHSAKVMLAFGTDYEYYNAVWVKNEWSRFLQLIAAGEKKTLIPCYKGIDAYDMPKEFARLQAQDMGKVGAIQDLLRGIEKILPREKSRSAETVAVQQSGNSNVTAPLLKRAFMFLEDEAWESANEYCEKVLDFAPECAEAYLGKTCATWQATSVSVLLAENCPYIEMIENDANFKKALRFSDEISAAALREKLAASKNCFYNKSQERLQALSLARDKATLARGIIAAHSSHTIGVKADGTVVAVGYNRSGQCNVSDWKDIVAVTAGSSHTVGLKTDGTVVAIGSNYCGERDVSDWKDIVAVTAGSSHTVGLKTDGTVVAIGADSNDQCNVSGWTDIVAITAGISHTVGLKRDGTVVVIGNNEYGECNVSDWTDIVAVSAGSLHTVGVRLDGTVVAVGHNPSGQCNVSGWTDIVAVAAGDFHTVGLKRDGTVVAVGDNDDGECNVSGWTDIVAIAAGINHTVGLKRDGIVVAIGANAFGECNVREWKLFNDIDNLEQERANIRKQLEEEKRAKLRDERIKLQDEQTGLQEKLPTIKGLFADKRRSEIEARLAVISDRLAEIDKELTKFDEELAKLSK